LSKAQSNRSIPDTAEAAFASGTGTVELLRFILSLTLSHGIRDELVDDFCIIDVVEYWYRTAFIRPNTSIPAFP
jgi:hypothetical protein